MGLAIKDGSGASKTMKTSTRSSEEIPHHVLDTPTLSRFRNLALNSTAVAIKASSGNLWGWNIINLSTSDLFLKFYNEAAGTVDPASDVPVLTLFIPAFATVFQPAISKIEEFTSAFSVRCVTGSGDTNTTAPSTSPIVELKYE